MQVVFARTALRDLASIGRSIAFDNPARALSFVDEITAICLDLGHMPYSAPLLDIPGSGAIRKKTFGNYVILYQADQILEILRVMHAARNYKKFVRFIKGATPES
jgi:toxin ParE1/3/4